MTRMTEAIYTSGVLRPLEDLSLREAQRVWLIVQPLDESPLDRTTALKQLREGIERMQFHSSRRLPSRDELHDRS